jgi:hypothetical protein
MAWYRLRTRRRVPGVGPARPDRGRPFLERLEDRLAPAVFTVTSAGDTGAGTGQAGDLRYCLTRANATPGLDTIQFAIPGGGLHTISLTSALPTITDAVVIDGYTQAGASPNTLATGDDAVLTVELNGAAAGATANGLTIRGASNCLIRGLTINRFGAAGLFMSGGSGNVVAGNFIGTDPAGTSSLGNHGGVSLRFASSGNTIGGTAPAARNLISGNTNGDGVGLIDVGTKGNVVQGDYIGTDRSGLHALPNTGGGGGAGGSGVIIYATASDNTIGGAAPGAGNLISGNHGQGIYMQSVVTGNVIQGNYIGTDVNGTTALGNTGEGVYIFGTGTERNNTIGGTAPGAGNVISGNGGLAGIRVRNPDNFIEGNYIGTDAGGTKSVPNKIGILFQTLSLTASFGNLVSGNVISGNQTDGIDISNSTGYRIEGNLIGTDRSGTARLANGSAGILLAAAMNVTIGGTTAAAGNVISGNGVFGIDISGAGTSGNVVLGNYIGTDRSGTAAVGNGYGISLDTQASNNTVGGTAAGSGNVLSGNGFGVSISDAASNNILQGNFIGTDVTGRKALGNTSDGVLLNSRGLPALNPSGNLIGGATPAARNVISGNVGFGIYFRLASGNTVQGNYIGTDATGNAALGNDFGIALVGGSDNLIGGTAPGTGNVISGNGREGIYLDNFGGTDPTTTRNNRIQGNLIGLNAAGTSAVGNVGGGIYVGVVSANTIGGTAPGAANVISGNTTTPGGVAPFDFLDGSGILLASSGPDNVILGNRIGTDGSGTAAIPNAGNGVTLYLTSATVGGSAAGAGNLISGNAGAGVEIYGSGTGGSMVSGNRIGTDGGGTGPLPNQGDGVLITEGATGNAVGGTAAGDGNVIAYNRKGVVITGSGTTGNRISGNAIFANAGPGIDLGDDGITRNDDAGHNGPNNFQNFPILTRVTASGGSRTVFGRLAGTPNTTYRIEFFASAAYDPSSYGQGQVYLGSADVTAGADGRASFRFSYTADPAHPFLTSTATDPAGNTSEFSGRNRRPVEAMPGPQTTHENVALSVAGTTVPSVGDPDNDGTDPLQVSLTVDHGTLTLTGLVGLIGSGNGTSQLTYVGTPADLNAALLGLTYAPALEFDGADALKLTVSDLVAQELGGPGVIASGVAITVVDMVHAPVLVVGAAAGNEGQAIPLTVYAGAVDTDGSEVLSIRIGGVPAAARLSEGTAHGHGVWTLTADQLNGLMLDADDNFAADLTVTATATLVTSGATADTTRLFLVTAANVAPTATLTHGGAIDVGDSTAVLFAAASDPSPADTDVGFRYSFALSAADLATGYAAASPDAVEHFSFGVMGTYAVYGRVFDKDGGFTDYVTTVTVLAPILPSDLPGAPQPNPTAPEPVIEPTAPEIVFPVSSPSAGPAAGSTSIAGARAAPPAADVQGESTSMFASSYDVAPPSAGAPPSVGPAVEAQARGPIQAAGRVMARAAPGPDAQLAAQASQIVAATLDGDDSVGLVELMLRENAVPVAMAALSIVRGDDAPTPAGETTAVLASAVDTPAPLTRLVKWLAIPAAASLAATGWLWRRARRGAARKPDSAA